MRETDSVSLLKMKFAAALTDVISDSAQHCVATSLIWPSDVFPLDAQESKPSATDYDSAICGDGT